MGGGDNGIAEPIVIEKDDASQGATETNHDAVAAALMSRLQSQFGDMDLTNLVNQDTGGASDAESDDSSLVEPTPEELQAWQQAQYKLGQWAREEKNKKSMSEADLVADALQRRRKDRSGAPPVSGDGGEEEEGWEEMFSPPVLGDDSVFFPSACTDGTEVVGPHPLLSELAAADPEVLGGTWKRLYSSTMGDGLSFHYILSALHGYGGPTVLILGTTPSAEHCLNDGIDQRGGTVGFYTTTPWEESCQFFGDDDCFLFTLLPGENRVNIIRPTAAGKSKVKRGNYMYCNPSTMTTTTRKTTIAGTGADGALYGIGIGGKRSQPRLHLTESLEGCRALAFDMTFEDGDLLPGGGAESLYHFDVDALEVWGVGGDGWIKKALLVRQAMRQKDEANLRKARTVDKTQLLDDFRSGFLDGGKTLFGHADHVTGRTESYAGDSHPP